MLASDFQGADSVVTVELAGPGGPADGAGRAVAVRERSAHRQPGDGVLVTVTGSVRALVEGRRGSVGLGPEARAYCVWGGI